MTTIATFVKAISYNRADHDYTATLDGQYIGSFRSYHDAEVALDQIVFDMLADTAVMVADEQAERAAETSTEVPLLVEPEQCHCNGWGCRVCEADQDYDFASARDIDPPADDLDAAIAKTTTCSPSHLCDNPNHNHSAVYTAPIVADALLAEADAVLNVCKACAAIHALLFAPTGACISCGDPVDRSGPGICKACLEIEQIDRVPAFAAIPADPWGVELPWGDAA